MKKRLLTSLRVLACLVAALPVTAHTSQLSCISAKLGVNLPERQAFGSMIRHRLALLRDPHPDSRAQWASYYQEWEIVTERNIQGSLDVYREAKALGHPHIHWLETRGFVLGPTAADVRVPPLESILRSYFEHMNNLVNSGFPPEDVIVPERIMFNSKTYIHEALGTPDPSNFRGVPFGAKIPEGFSGTTHLIPFGFHLSSLDRGVFGIGESLGLGSPSVRNQVTFLMHDLAHLALFEEFPWQVMRGMKEAGLSLTAADVSLPMNSRGWPDAPFHPHHVRFLHENGLLERWVAEQGLSLDHFVGIPDSKIADRINELPSDLRLPLHALYITGRKPFSESEKAALRYRVALESSSLLSKNAAQRLEGMLKNEGLLPERAPGDFYRADQIRAHLLTLGPERVARMNELLVKWFPRLVTIYGGSSRDIVQNKLRFDASGPTGNSHFFTMEYLWYKAKQDRQARSRTKPEKMADNAAKLAAAAIMSGDIDMRRWLADIGLPVRKGSALEQWICGTGAFMRDDHWFAYCL